MLELPEGAKRPRGESNKYDTHEDRAYSNWFIAPLFMTKAREFSSRMAKAKDSKCKLPTKRTSSNRFDFDWNDDDFQALKQGFVPTNTVTDTKKCLKLFKEWADERNKRFSSDQQVPEDILLTDNSTLLCHWLCKFSMEMRKKDGSPYPPRTINHNLMGLQRYIRAEKKNNLNLLTDSTFLPLKNLLDALYRRLHSVGVGCSVQRTQAVTEDDEDALWRSGILDPDTPQGLLNCVFF